MKIESNVPLPARRGVHSEIGKTASQMKEGDSLYSIKPRITELCRYELVEDTGDRIRNSRNRNEVVWAITKQGKEIINAMSQVREGD